MTKAGCRISRVRYKDSNVTMLPTRQAPDPHAGTTGEFISTLVWLLGEARSGRIVGYSLAMIVDDAEECFKTVISSDVAKSADRTILLGALRRMEHEFMNRAWND